MSYDENDAAEEAFYERMYEDFRREYSDEIADEITTGEIVAAVISAHAEWWPRTEAALLKARVRQGEASNEEAVFHAGRALDGYVKNVLIIPLMGALVERFERFMPAGFPIRQSDFFKSVTGLGSSAAMAEYTLSLVSSDPGTIIRNLRALLGGGENSHWRQRDRAFHAPTDVSAEIAKAIIDAAETILVALAADLERLSEKDRQERERIEFSNARMQTLRFLAVVYDEEPDALLEEGHLPRNYDNHERLSETLGIFVARGFVERLQSEGGGWGRPEFLYRMTPEGRAYFGTEVEPRLAQRRSA